MSAPRHVPEMELNRPARRVEVIVEHRGDAERRRIGLDGRSFRKLHEYVTVMTEPDRRHVMAVVDGRTGEPVDAGFASAPSSFRGSAELVAMDK